MQLVPKRQIGGNLYKIDNTMPQITQRYVALLNKGIPAQAAFDTAHLSLIEDLINFIHLVKEQLTYKIGLRMHLIL